MGVHAWEISLEDYGMFSMLILAAPLIYVLCTACATSALCLFYGRLKLKPIFQAGVWTTLFVIVGKYTSIFFSLLFACRPIAASWDPTLQPIAECINAEKLYNAAAVIGIVIDVLLVAIPVQTIWGPQVPMNQKIGLTIMFGVGSITMFTSIIHLIAVIPALKSLDQPWVIGQGTLWIFIETNLLVICACLPTLRRFLKHVAPRFIGEISNGPSDRENDSHKLRTWGSMSSRPKRQYDTLMNTVGQDDDYIRLDNKGDNKKLVQGQFTVTAKNVQSDHDSEEAILFERSVQVTFSRTRIKNKSWARSFRKGVGSED